MACQTVASSRESQNICYLQVVLSPLVGCAHVSTQEYQRVCQAFNFDRPQIKTLVLNGVGASLLAQ